MEKNNKFKILFVTEKWCDGKPELGTTMHRSYLFGSLASSNLDVNISAVHFDEFYMKYKRHINDALPAIFDEVKPDLVVTSFLGSSWLNPSKEVFEVLKNKKANLCFAWCDTGYDWAIDKINDLGELADLHVSFGSDYREHKFLDRHLWLWAPPDERLFYPENDKTTPVSFIGSLKGYRDRPAYINYALENGVELLLAGGQREGKLSPEKYAEYIRNSQIGINFPESPSGIDQCKGRVIEIISCGSMLLERKNNATRKILTPGQDYVEFDGLSDFVDKIQYFIRNEKERKAIALNGYNKYCKNYSASIFWKRVLEGCGYEL